MPQFNDLSDDPARWTHKKLFAELEAHIFQEDQTAALKTMAIMWARYVERKPSFKRRSNPNKLSSNPDAVAQRARRKARSDYLAATGETYEESLKRKTVAEEINTALTEIKKPD